jgi:hypothetical protein
MITHKSIGYSGRLGNQMFQYAVCKVLSIKINQPLVLPNNTNIKQDGCFDFTNNKWIPYKLDLLDCFDLSCTIGEIEGDKIELEGYFQNYSYVEKYEVELIKEFKFKQHILDKSKNIINQYKEPIAVHIRRGDYVAHPGFWNITQEYIQKALYYFDDNEYTFIVFSDDIEWCKQIFPKKVVFMEGYNQFEDLCMMSLCKHNIISNSTYGWWGAFLNQNVAKEIVAPRNWYTDNRDITGLYPQNWTII